MHGSNSYIFVNGVKIFQLRAKDSELNEYPLCLGNISKDFTVENVKERGLNEYVYDFSVIITVLMLIIIWIFINIYWKNMM